MRVTSWTPAQLRARVSKPFSALVVDCGVPIFRKGHTDPFPTQVELFRNGSVSVRRAGSTKHNISASEEWLYALMPNATDRE